MKKLHPYQSKNYLSKLAWVLLLFIFIPNVIFAQKGYDKIGPYKNGRAKVFKGDKMGFINEAGEEVIPCIYEYIGDFVNGRAKVILALKEGYISYEGEVIIPIKYDKIGPFKNGLAKVYVKGKVGLINYEGEEIAEPKYDLIGEFNRFGIAKVQFDRKEMFMRTSGETFLPVDPNAEELEE
ncbi:MAG: WG repeat-containing protein [Bacteroidia bacterium]